MSRKDLIALGRPLEAHSVEVPDQREPALNARLAEARQQLTDKGKLGFFARDVKKAVERCRVDGLVPSTPEELDLCLSALQQTEKRRQFATRWAKRMERVNGPDLGDINPEESAGGHLDGLARTLGFDDRWAQLSEALGDLGVHLPPATGPEELAELLSVLDAVMVRPEERAAVQWFEVVHKSLREGAAHPNASAAWQELAAALDQADDERWNEIVSLLQYLATISEHAHVLRDLGVRLRAVAPRWAARIDQDRSAAGSPDALLAAWQWRQLESWLTSIRSTGDPAALQAEIATLTYRRLGLVASLVEARAWRLIADRLGDRERLALNRYVDAMKRYGKTGGKFAPRWIREMREAMDHARGAVPVWIMTTNRALSSFTPTGVPPFDVLIIDEASQLGLGALPLLSLATRTIVVGDDQQTSPENVGADQARFHELLEQHLSFISGFRTIFDINASLYDLAKTKFPDVVTLTEHFRCLPPIIEFSNTRYYDRRIVPLRDRPPRPGWRPLGAIKVLDGYRSGDRNVPEAMAVVDLVRRLCADPAYDGMDFGVISLMGSTQSQFIADALREQLTPAVYEARRIRCGEPAMFQGDERNVIVLSTVVATDPKRPTAGIAAMTGVPAQRRMNVAASRACDQMWVVHSIDPDRFPAGDPRAELIRHCQAPARISEQLDRLEERCDSDFERAVLRRIIARGHTGVRVQEVVGRYRIDIVVEGPESRLAVECDGDRWHGEEEWHRDRARQTVLERAGWTFVRIRGSSFYRDPDNTLDTLWARLDELEIPTGDEWRQAPPQTTVLTLTSTELPDPTKLDSPTSKLQPEEPPWVSLRPDTPADVDVKPTAAKADADVAWEADESQRALPIEPPPPLLEKSDANAVRLSPCRSYQGARLQPVSSASQLQLAEGLARIVEVEGPMHALTAYQAYVRASGSQRVGKEIRATLNRAAVLAFRQGLVRQITDDVPGQIEKTLYFPGSDPVVLRERGQRLLEEIPRSEIKTLIDRLGVSGPPEVVARAVLDTLGLTRLTTNATTYIQACAHYRWNAPN